MTNQHDEPTRRTKTRRTKTQTLKPCAAFTPNVKYNLTAFRYPGSRLHFAMKTSSNATFLIGMKSGNIDGVGQKWLTFQAGSDPFGFLRDGKWQVARSRDTDV